MKRAMLNNQSSFRASLRRIRALIIKEFYQIIYDPSSILITIVLPVILLFLYGFGVSLDLNNVNIGLLLEDKSPDARGFAQSLTSSGYFNVTFAPNRAEVEKLLLAGKIRGFVVVPEYFTTFRYSPEAKKAPIQIITDGGEPNTAKFVQNYVSMTWGNWLIQEKIQGLRPPITFINVQPRFWFNDALESRNFLLPGSLAIIMTLIGTTLTALVIAREWERGTMEALMATPVRITEILLAKLISYYCMAMCSMVFCLIGTILFYGIPFRGSFFVLGVVTTAFLSAALGTGLLISTLTKNQLAASQAAQVVGLLPAYILSGFIFEIPSMPQVIQFITHFVPARYFVRSLLCLFLVGDVADLIIQDILAMVCFGVIIFACTSRIIVKRLD
jgi:ABC-2 type transport system permease protein